MNIKNKISLLSLLAITSILVGCGGGGGSSSSDSNTDTETDTDTGSGTSDVLSLAVDTALFKAGALEELVTTESCTLTNGDVTDCYVITINGFPSDQIDLGPFCPESTLSTAEDGGIWFDGGGDIYDIDGDFILNLATLYNDNNWLLYDPVTFEVNVTDTQVSCDAAARPDVDVQYQNHCVECSVSYINGGQPTSTVTIPITPVHRTTSSAVSGNVGISLNGVILAAPAPVNAILGAYTIAAFDDCGGHVNLVAGYHYHGATGCSENTTEADGHAAMFAYAMDGYGIYSMLDSQGNEPTDLDSCRGHEDEIRGYHYHAASAAENMFIGCNMGETAR